MNYTTIANNPEFFARRAVAKIMSPTNQHIGYVVYQNSTRSVSKFLFNANCNTPCPREVLNLSKKKTGEIVPKDCDIADMPIVGGPTMNDKAYLIAKEYDGSYIVYYKADLHALDIKACATLDFCNATYVDTDTPHMRLKKGNLYAYDEDNKGGYFAICTLSFTDDFKPSIQPTANIWTAKKDFLKEVTKYKEKYANEIKNRLYSIRTVNNGGYYELYSEINGSPIAIIFIVASHQRDIEEILATKPYLLYNITGVSPNNLAYARLHVAGYYDAENATNAYNQQVIRDQIDARSGRVRVLRSRNGKAVCIPNQYDLQFYTLKKNSKVPTEKIGKQYAGYLVSMMILNDGILEIEPTTQLFKTLDAATNSFNFIKEHLLRTHCTDINAGIANVVGTERDFYITKPDSDYYVALKISPVAYADKS